MMLTVLLTPPHIRVTLPPGKEVRSEVVRNMVHVRCVPASVRQLVLFVPHVMLSFLFSSTSVFQSLTGAILAFKS